MRHQMAYRHARDDVGVAHAEVGQIFSDRGVEVELAGFDQPHRGGGDESLGVRADLEKGLLVDRERVAGAGDAEAGAEFAAVAVNADGDARDVELFHRVGDSFANLFEGCFGVHQCSPR